MAPGVGAYDAHMADDPFSNPEEPVVRDVDDVTRAADDQSGAPIRLIVLFVVIAALIIFIAQNDHDAAVRFLGFEGTFSVSVIILASALLGAIIALLATAADRRRRRKARQAAATPPSDPSPK